jgi:hypothetical protein
MGKLLRKVRPIFTISLTLLSFGRAFSEDTTVDAIIKAWRAREKQTESFDFKW